MFGDLDCRGFVSISRASCTYWHCCYQLQHSHAPQMTLIKLHNLHPASKPAMYSFVLQLCTRICLLCWLVNVLNFSQGVLDIICWSLHLHYTMWHFVYMYCHLCCSHVFWFFIFSFSVRCPSSHWHCATIIYSFNK